MEAGEGRTPVIQDPDKVPIGQAVSDGVFRYGSETEAVKTGLDDHLRGVEGKLAIDSHLQFAAVLSKLPGIESPRANQAQVYALMGAKVLGVEGLARPVK